MKLSGGHVFFLHAYAMSGALTVFERDKAAVFLKGLATTLIPSSGSIHLYSHFHFQIRLFDILARGLLATDPFASEFFHFAFIRSIAPSCSRRDYIRYGS